MAKRRKSHVLDPMEDFVELQKSSLAGDPFDSAFTSKGRIYPFYKGAKTPISITIILFPLAALAVLVLFLQLAMPFRYKALSYGITLVIIFFALRFLERIATNNPKSPNRKG